MVWLKPPRKIVFLREKKLSDTNLLALRHIKREKALPPVDLRRSKIACVALKGVGNKEEGKKRRGLGREGKGQYKCIVPVDYDINGKSIIT